MNYKSIYISSSEERAGSLIIAIGFMEMIKARYEKVAFFRPIIPDGEEIENDIAFMCKHFELDMNYKECCGFTISEYIEAYGRDTEDQLHESLIRKVKKLLETYDFLLIEGYHRDAFGSVFDFDINLEIAKNLNTVFVPIIKAKGKSSHKIVNEIQLTIEMIEAEGCTHFATFVNRANEEIIANIKKRIEAKEITDPIYILPEVKELNTPTLAQVTQSLSAKMLLGTQKQLEHLVHGNKIAAMGVENYLSRIDNGDIVIIPGDRIDIIMASILSYYAKNHTNIIGIVLSGGISLSEPFMKLLEDFSETAIPMFTVEPNSYETAIALDKISADITTESTRKITLAKGLFDAATDKEKMRKRFQSSANNTLTPIMFQYRLFEQAQSNRQKIVLPESDDERILRATEILIHRDIVNIILLGNRKVIEKRCKKIDIDISKAEIIDPEESPLQEQFAQTFYEMRKKKGLTLDAARDAMVHVNYFATMLVQEGLADGMVSGATHTTADTVRPALQIIKTKADISIVSSIFFMCLDTKVLVYGDCAVNMDPTAEELAQIAVSSADTAKAFGIDPKVALLSYSTGSSGTGPEVEKVREATKLAQAMRPDYLIEGPIQYDAAIDEKVAKKKLPDSQVAGKATVFIFPDLNTGNNTYKAVQRSTDALAIGPVLQGLRLPVNDLSRGCLVDDIVNTVAITAIQAQRGEEK
ncbi:MAG: phosphate acetyltransferase [Campylobacterota bacterium]|nr:phosphate acetyltransferase [Campylobacterota bacterium]